MSEDGSISIDDFVAAYFADPEGEQRFYEARRWVLDKFYSDAPGYPLACKMLDYANKRIAELEDERDRLRSALDSERNTLLSVVMQGRFSVKERAALAEGEQKG